MYTLAQRLLIARCWIGSFVHRAWAAEHYPIVVREQQGVPDEARWCARVLAWGGPVGLGRTEVGARGALITRLHNIAARRWSQGKSMPRPGTGLPIEFARADRVTSDPDLLEAFVVKALSFKPNDPVFISDESSLPDFGNDERVSMILNNIQLHFGVTIRKEGRLLVADILDEIRRAS